MIALHFPKLACFDRTLEPATVAVPFPQGKLRDLSGCRILDKEGVVYPGQFRATAKWPDGSVKWLLAHLQADLPANKACDYYLDIASTQKQTECFMAVSDKLIDNGVLQVALSDQADALFDYIDTPEGRYTREEITPFMIKDEEGNSYIAGVGKKGWEVIEEGPVRAMLRTRGSHVGEKGTFFDYVITLYMYAGQPWMDLDYRVINKEEGKPLVLEKAVDGLKVSDISAMSMRITPAATGEVKTYTAHSNYFTIYKEGTNELLVDEKMLQFAGNEHNPEVLYGVFYGDWHDEKRGVSVSIYQAQQNFPKRVSVSETGIAADLIPEETGAVEFIQGMSKTHRIQIHFHAPDADRAKELTFRAFQYQLPDKPAVDKSAYIESSIFPDIFNHAYNKQMEQYIDGLFANRSHALGMMHWGDNPDEGYTAQGRGMGDVVWINGEYDAGHAFYLYYVTHGQRKAYAAMKCATEHTLDVDICHYSTDPLRHGGQIEHSARHATHGCGPSHEWVEGLLDYYHETGDPDILEIALGVGHNVERVLVAKIFNHPRGKFTSAREVGWALISFTALYNETYDDIWLQFSEPCVDLFFEWVKLFGGFLSTYTEHTYVRVPFMVSVAVNSLKGYYDIKPSEELKKLIVTAVEDIAEHCMDEYTGLFIYKDLLSLSQTTLSTLFFSPLTYAYELTGDTKFLEYGVETVRGLIRNIPHGSGGRLASHQCVIYGAGKGSNKGFASSIQHIMVYYKALMDHDMFPG